MKLISYIIVTTIIILLSPLEETVETPIEPRESVSKPIEVVEVDKETPEPKTQTTEPVKEPTARTGDCSLVNNYDWDRQVAYAVCMAESGGNPNAVNWNDNHGVCIGSFGLMQLGCIHAHRGDIHDPISNMNIAYQIYKEQSWYPWGAWTNGSFRNHL